MNEEKAKELFEENIGLAYWAVGKYFPLLVGDEDIQQEALIGLYKACLVYDESKGKFATLAIAVIMNEIRMFFRRANKEKAVVISLNDPVPGTDEELLIMDIIPDPSQQICGVSYNSLKEFTKTLTGRYKKVLEMKVEGFTQSEIAKAVGISQSQCGKDLRRIKDKYLEWSDLG